MNENHRSISSIAKRFRVLSRFDVIEDKLSSSGTAMLSNGKVDIRIINDSRGNVVECSIGLTTYRGRTDYQYAVEKAVDFCGGDSEITDIDIEDHISIDEQIDMYFNLLEDSCAEILSGEERRYESLHEFSRGYDAGYTIGVNDMQ